MCCFSLHLAILSFLGGVKSFDNYYKRRINRIYPTVFAWAVVSCLLFKRDWNMVTTILHGGGWFVSCIMLYYIVLYFVRKYFVDHLKLVLALSCLISAGLYFVFHEGIKYNMYGDTYYKWVHYFIFMMQGAMMGLYSMQKPIDIKNGWMELFKTSLCVIGFYVICAFKNSESWNFVQVFSLIPLFGIVYYVYRLCNVGAIKNLYIDTKFGWCMNAIGGLCLEIYLVQSYLFTDVLNCIFPLNIPIIFIEIVLFAYIVRCLSRVWSQTFGDGDYKWKEVFHIAFLMIYETGWTGHIADRCGYDGWHRYLLCLCSRMFQSFQENSARHHRDACRA